MPHKPRAQGTNQGLDAECSYWDDDGSPAWKAMAERLEWEGMVMERDVAPRL